MVDRLRSDVERMQETTLRAIELGEIFASFNDAANPLRDNALAPHGEAATVNAMMDAVIRELVVILVRVFDGPGQRGALKSDKVSFPVMLELSRLPGISTYFAADARVWYRDFLSDENEKSVVQAALAFETNLARLSTETPNRWANGLEAVI